MLVTLRLNEEDQDILDAIENCETNNKSQRIKNLLRLGITVEKIDTLQLLFTKLSENGLIQPVEFAASSSPGKKSVADEEADEFVRNMFSSFSPLDLSEDKGSVSQEL